jgi:hypothetical protein
MYWAGSIQPFSAEFGKHHENSFPVDMTDAQRVLVPVLRAIWRSLCGDLFGAEVHREAPSQPSAGFDWFCRFRRKSLAFHDLQIFPIGARPSFSESVSAG